MITIQELFCSQIQQPTVSSLMQSPDVLNLEFQRLQLVTTVRVITATNGGRWQDNVVSTIFHPVPAVLHSQANGKVKKKGAPMADYQSEGGQELVVGEAMGRARSAPEPSSALFSASNR